MTRGLPHKLGVTLNLGVVQVRGDWEPNHAERAAAWEVYVELVTRVATVPLDPDEGLLREALSSLYSVFESTRECCAGTGRTWPSRSRTGRSTSRSWP